MTASWLLYNTSSSAATSYTSKAPLIQHTVANRQCSAHLRYDMHVELSHGGDAVETHLEGIWTVCCARNVGLCGCL